MVLVSGDGGEAGLREHEGAVCAALPLARQVHHVQPRLVAVHRVQDYLSEGQNVLLRCWRVLVTDQMFLINTTISDVFIF